MKEYFDQRDQKVILGKEIGSGGEGIIYDVSSTEVAKIYREQLSHEKQEKLREMVRNIHKELHEISAWPINILHKSISGEINGFLMPKVQGYSPIHDLYGPKYRQQIFPNADWLFLIDVAIKVTIAFGWVHYYGHVIGDVNESNIMVAKDGAIKLIDCDSFQIITSKNKYLCTVGKPEFTPPELQGHSFGRLERTQNHDNFGLAVIIFQLLLMGKFPFSGVPLKGDIPEQGEAIKNFQFAFGKDAHLKNFKPPPNSPTLQILPNFISELFECAFSEKGVKQRPSPKEWFKNLNQLKEQLTTCSADKIHKYYRGLSSCPWCEFEQKNLMFFVNLNPNDENEFNLDQVWLRIVAIKLPTSEINIRLIKDVSATNNLATFNLELKKLKDEISNINVEENNSKNQLEEIKKGFSLSYGWLEQSSNSLSKEKRKLNELKNQMEYLKTQKDEVQKLLDQKDKCILSNVLSILESKFQTEINNHYDAFQFEEIKRNSLINQLKGLEESYNITETKIINLNKELNNFNNEQNVLKRFISLFIKNHQKLAIENNITEAISVLASYEKDINLIKANLSELEILKTRECVNNFLIPSLTDNISKSVTKYSQLTYDMQSYVIKNNQLSDKFQKVKQERMLIEQRLNNLNGAKKMCLDNLSKLKDREINHIQNKLNKLKNIEANIKNELQKKFNRIKLEFDRKLSNLKDISNNYKSSLNKQKIEIEELNYSLYGQQLNYFLDQYFIKKCNNISIGLARKSKLSSFGIETAADISYDKIIKIPTFGPHFTQRLVNWRKNLEKDFVFNPNQGVNPSDIALIKQRYLPVLRPLEKILLAGENELLQMRNNLHSEQEKSKFELEKIVYQVKQLENDLKIVNTS